LQQGAAQTELGAGTNLLGQGSTNLMNEANLANQNRQRQVGDVSGIASGVASIAAPFLGGAGPGATSSVAPQLGDLPPELGAAPGFDAGNALAPSGADTSIFGTEPQPVYSGSDQSQIL